MQTFKVFRPFDAFRAPSLASSETSIPDPALALPLQGSLLPSSGTGTLTHTRATSAWMWRDSDGRMWRDYAAGRVLIECPAGELRVEGARRVRNLLTFSADFSNAVWAAQSAVRSYNDTAPDGTVAKLKLVTATATSAGIVRTSVATGSAIAGKTFVVYALVYATSEFVGQIRVRGTGTTQEGENLNVTFLANQWRLISVTKSFSVSADGTSLAVFIYPSGFGGTTPRTFWMQYAGVGDITGLTNQSAPEYLSTNVLSYPFHGAGADGVKYYSTLADGTPIFANEIKAVTETAATNLLLNSATLSTQNVTVTAQPYTLSFRGTGSVTLSGTATGTLTGTGEHNRVQLTFTPTAGTLTLTVSGTVTTAVLIAGTTAGTYIPTTNATVQRHADQLVLTNYTLPASGTLYFEAEVRDWAQVGGQLFGDGTEYLLKPLTNQSGIQAFDGTNTANGPTGTPSGTMRFAVRWNSTSGKMRLAANGTLGAEANYDGNWNLASYILAGGFDGAIRNLRTYDRAFTDAQMRRLTQ